MSRTNIWREMKKLCDEAEVNPSKVFPHNLRHLFARVFYSIEKDIAKLADILGHSSINTTRIYIISTGNEHKKKLELMKLIVWNIIFIMLYILNFYSHYSLFIGAKTKALCVWIEKLIERACIVLKKLYSVVKMFVILNKYIDFSRNLQ